MNRHRVTDKKRDDTYRAYDKATGHEMTKSLIHTVARSWHRGEVAYRRGTAVRVVRAGVRHGLDVRTEPLVLPTESTNQSQRLPHYKHDILRGTQ